ncbi:MAG: hypothetical protein RLZZ144_908 [Pseudomonadota bacterium]|jgi:hypothetical protein
MNTIVEPKKNITKPAAVAKKSVRKPAAAKTVVVAKTPVASKTLVAKKTAIKPIAKVAVKPEAKKPVVVKIKTVRDTFSMPETDYALIAMLKKSAQAGGLKVKKNELLRVGLLLLSQLKTPELKSLLSKFQATQA